MPGDLPLVYFNQVKVPARTFREMQSKPEAIELRIWTKPVQLIALTSDHMHQHLMYQIIQLFLIQPQSSNFLAYLATKDMITLILDQDYQLPVEATDSILSNYRIMTFSSSNGCPIGMLEAIVHPLTIAKIDVILVTAPDEKYVLVSAEQFQDAMQCLKAAHQFVTQQDLPNNEGEDEEKVFRVEVRVHMTSNAPGDCEIIPQRLQVRRKSTSMMELTQLRGYVAVATLPIEKIPTCTHALLQTFFYSQTSDTDTSSVRSFVLTRGQLTLVLDTQLLRTFPPDSLIAQSANWNVFHVTKGAVPTSDVALLNHIGLTVASANIPVLYLETISDDYVLIEKCHLKEALGLLMDRYATTIDMGSLE